MDQQLANSASPFHPGEQRAQQRIGVREKLEKVGRKHIRDYLPDQHREFYAALPFVLLGTVDAQGRPWASLVAGRPGFTTSPHPRRLDIASQPLFGDPLNQTLEPGAEVGLLGMQPETRRRNRITGRIDTIGAEGFSIEVGQSFGNCPKYIQSRAVSVKPGIDTPQAERPTLVSDRFDAGVRALIERADTLFIATAYLDGPDTPARGADISHRGGKPGFVRVEDDKSFVVPDFSGNLHFNTVGNILSNPKAGFLFIDFDSGDLVYMTGYAEVIWKGKEIETFAGAERLIRFRVETVVRVEASLPLSFAFGDYSPNLERTGAWPEETAA